MGKKIDLYDKTGNSRFQSIDGMLEEAKEFKDINSGMVILVENFGDSAFDVHILTSNLDVAEANLIIDHVKQQLIGPANQLY